MTVRVSDEVIIAVSSGRGGNGCESFFRRPDRKRVPNGGSGGQGGDVIIRASAQVGSLGGLRPRQRFVAADGQAGAANRKRGKDGEPLYLNVPPGTLIVNADHDLRIRDLVSADDEVCVAKGGRGGSGNSDERPAQHGAPGESLDVKLDLRVTADVALIGTPNSGKSTLLNCLTGSHAKVGSYAFTTQDPQLGSFETSRYERVVCMELPGLVQGSSQGKGIGNYFLKHLTRVKLLLYLLDPHNRSGHDLEACLDILEAEVRTGNPHSAALPRRVLIAKADLLERRPAWRGKDSPLFVSGETGEGLDTLRGAIENFWEGS